MLADEILSAARNPPRSSIHTFSTNSDHQKEKREEALQPLPSHGAKQPYLAGGRVAAGAVRRGAVGADGGGAATPEVVL
jgi:hypothetical protein